MCSFGGKNPEDERKKVFLYGNLKINRNIWEAVIHQTERTPNLHRVSREREVTLNGNQSPVGTPPVYAADSFSKGPSVRSWAPVLAVWGAELGAEQPWCVPGRSWTQKPPGRCSRYRALSPTLSLRQEHHAGEWLLLECPVVVTAVPMRSAPTSGQFSGKALGMRLLQNSAPCKTETHHSCLQPPSRRGCGSFPVQTDSSTGELLKGYY